MKASKLKRTELNWFCIHKNLKSKRKIVHWKTGKKKKYPYCSIIIKRYGGGTEPSKPKHLKTKPNTVPLNFILKTRLIMNNKKGKEIIWSNQNSFGTLKAAEQFLEKEKRNVLALINKYGYA